MERDPLTSMTISPGTGSVLRRMPRCETPTLGRGSDQFTTTQVVPALSVKRSCQPSPRKEGKTMGQAFGGALRLTGVTDDALITRCLVHDEEAWRLLVERYTSYIYSIAIRGFGIDAEEAREVVQESLLKLFEGLRGYRGEGEFRAWLRQIVRNCCLAYLRRRRVTEVLEDTLPD